MSASTTVVAPETAAVPPPKSRSGHLHQVDMIRVVTFSLVIFAHVLNGVNNMNNPIVCAISMTLHFTRNAFFFLTALVLVHSYRDRAPRPFSFWHKRIAAVAAPYLIWSAIYTAINNPDATVAQFIHIYGQNLLTGAAMYNLYFLVVSIQFYILFPLFIAVLRALRTWPLLTLAGAALIQLTVNAVESQPAPSTGFVGRNWEFTTSLLPSYLFYFVLGGVIAFHFDSCVEWVRQHTRFVLGLAAVALGVAQVQYFSLVDNGLQPLDAGSPLRPFLMVWFTPAILAVFAIGVRWADRRRPGSTAAAMMHGGTERSFGIFLCHPLVLLILFETLTPELSTMLGATGATLATYLLGVTGAFCLLEVLRRTPLAKQLTGRPKVPFALPSGRLTPVKP